MLTFQEVKDPEVLSGAILVCTECSLTGAFHFLFCDSVSTADAAPQDEVSDLLFPDKKCII